MNLDMPLDKTIRRQRDQGFVVVTIESHETK
jgi:hypothetical protein